MLHGQNAESLGSADPRKDCGSFV